MAILKIAKLGHPVLVKKTNEINNLDELNLKKIVFDMSETMLDSDGIGLAAPQVHLSHRMFIFRNPEIEDDDKINISVFIKCDLALLVVLHVESLRKTKKTIHSSKAD